MYNSGAFPWSGFAYDSTPCKDIHIIGNTFKNINRGASAIGNHLWITGKYPSNVCIEYNNFDNVDNCFTLHDCYNVYLSKNISVNCGYFVDISNQQNIITDVLIKDNYFNGRYSGIADAQNRFIGINKATVAAANRVKIKGNTILNAERHAIGMTADNVLIHNNVVDGCGKNGIYLYGGNVAVISNNILKNTNKLLAGDATSIRIGDNASMTTKNVNVIGNNYVDIFVNAGNTSSINQTANYAIV